jgi:hypothetical protein
MTNDEFAALFTREALRRFQPRPGTEGLIPQLEVHTPTEVAVYVLALDGYNDWDTRREYLRALGERSAALHPDVEVVRFGSEAWMKRVTPQEQATRGTRPIASYADKEECIVVFGQQASGALRIAQAPLYRRATGKVERLGTWQVVTADDAHGMRSPLLAAFWEGYRQGRRAFN